MEKLDGVIVDIMFSNDSNGYLVARLKTEDDIVVITGTMPGVDSGENIDLDGSWVIHESYGRQFNVSEYRITIPSTSSGILAFLSSGIITGVGEKMAKRIVEKFGTSTFEIIQKTPERLLEVEGIGKKKLGPIVDSFNESMGVKNVIIALSPYGISPKLCMKIYKKYGENSLNNVMENPYKLIDDIVGIGFKIADEIAVKCGIDMESKFRIEQGILHVLKESINSGHTFLPEDILIRECIELLKVELTLIEDCVYELALNRKIVIEKLGDYNIIYLHKYYKSEVDVCKALIEFSSTEFRDVKIDIEAELENFQLDNDIELAMSQMRAVKSSFENGVMVLTGGPGTGKTTTINTIIHLFRKNKKKVVLAAPTGRAAKRMTETTGREAKTIHRLLEIAFDADDRTIFVKNEEEPIDADVIIIDEVSMVDIFLMDNLLKAMKKNTRLILVGDADQLPSVGAGNVLSDIISSEVIEVVRLTEIFRQAQESDIVMNAHRINKGQDIEANKKGTDFYFINKDSEEEIISEVKSLVGGRLSSFYNIDSLKDIQILSPMRRGYLGVTNMNLELQRILNPKKSDFTEVELMKRVFRVGDKVMQIRNNYSKEWENEAGNDFGEGVYNGDIGYVFHIDKSNKQMYILFDEYKIFKYKFEDLDEIEHCFCTTVHKSQGSEFPVVIIPMTWGPPMLLSRNLIYTAVTRAKKLVIIVGMKKYLNMMIANNMNNDRFSNLGYRLKKYKLNNIVDLS